MSESPRATGRCLCGAIEYEVHAPLRDVVVCHCSMCRRHHGHVGAYAGADAAGLRLVSDRGLAWYASSEAVERGFCRECGSSLFFRPRRGTFVAIAAGTLDAPTGLRTARHIYVADRGDYYEITDAVDQEP